MCLLNKKNFSLSIFLSLMILSSNTLHSYQDKNSQTIFINLNANKGTELYRSGDFKAAYREWRKLHIQSRNSTAQYNIGILYYYGQGFEKDYQTALLWFNRSAKKFNKIISITYRGSHGRTRTNTSFRTTDFKSL